MKRRLLLAAALLLVVCHFGRAAFNVRAAPADFTISSLNCSIPLGDVFITTAVAGNPALGDLTVVITPPSGAPSTILINAAIQPAAAYTVTTGATIDLQVGSGATQAPNPANNPLHDQDRIALSVASLLVPGAVVSIVSASTPTTIISTQTCPASTSVAVRLVSPNGFDFIDAAQTIPNTVCGKDLPAATAPTATAPGPCLTIDNAIKYSDQGDTVFVEFGIYEICHTIEVNKLLRITTRSTVIKNNGASNFGATVAAGDAVSGAILHSFSGDTIFHVTAIGFPDGTNPTGLSNNVPNNFPINTRLFFVNHVQIDGLHLGGAFKPGSAAIMLDNDSYTTVSNNWLGGDPIQNPGTAGVISGANGGFTGIPCSQPQAFPPAKPLTSSNKTEVMGDSIGILLSNSDHANLFNNAILGTSDFKFSPLLAVGDVQSGFGITTAECIGNGPDASNAVTIAVNTISRNVNAAVWLCSDGGGGHLISQNTIRSNGRGVVLRAITGSLLDANTIGDDYADGIVIYDSASNNTVQKNVIESHRTPGAAGIRLGGFGSSLFPLQTQLFNNTIRRNYTGVLIAGARNTTGQGNIITAEDVRTAVFLQVGAVGSPSITQPLGTSFNLNQIVSNGSCTSDQGCAVRLDQFVSSDVDATNNNFGLPVRTDVNSVLWHKPNDPTLGFVSANQATGNLLPVAPPIATAVGAPGAVGNGLVAACPVAAAPGATPAAAAAAAAGPCCPVTSALGGVGAPAATGPTGGAPAVAAPTVSATPLVVPPASSATPIVPGTSPALTAGQPGGATAYQPPCTFITVPASIGPSLPAGRFLSLFQPVDNIFSAYRVDNSTHLYQAIYFSNSQAPVDVSNVKPGDILSICLTDNVTGPP